jgi:hypothetical protein
LPFEEFRRCLLNAGVGKNIYDVHQLFQASTSTFTGLPSHPTLSLSSSLSLPPLPHTHMLTLQALGGKNGGNADIDLFFSCLSPILVDPRTEISNKSGPSSIMSIGRADRHLRQSIRKSYKIVKHEIAEADPTCSGFIPADSLYQILVKRCTPLTFQDFRFLTQQVRVIPLSLGSTPSFIGSF